MIKGSLAGRARRVAVAALAFLIVSAGPVLAASAASESEESGLVTEASGPSASEVAAVEDEQHERAEWLSSAEAQTQREASRAAYANLSADDAQSLLVEAFPAQLSQLNADPARVLSELEIQRPLGTYGALVSDENGETSIVESSVPIESEAGGEDTEPVDLTLERSGNSFAPTNPLTEVELPISTKDPIQLQSGLEVQMPTNDAHEAQSLGDKNLFYPETETTTDTLVSPISAGVEIFEQLRSPESPEQFRFGLRPPAGAELRASEAAGVEVLSSSGRVIGRVPPPSAIDAQGALVPVTMSVEGESLVVEVSHRSHDLAYPILVDPQFLEEGSVAYNYWGSSSNAAYNLSNSSSLSASAQGSGVVYAANTHGQWVYTAPGQTTYIAAATFFSPTFTLPGNCATEQPTNQPHGYAGLFNPYSGGYVGLGLWSGGSSYLGEYQTGWVGGPGVREAMVGIGTGTASVHHKCAFTFSVSGATIQEKDPEAPTINSVSGTSSNWVKDLTVTANVSDPGLGVKGVTLSPEGNLPHTNSVGNCTGVYTSRCPSSTGSSFGVSYFAEGERSASLSAYDPLGPDEAAHVSSSYKWTTKLDRSNPEVELEGQFTKALKEAEEQKEGKKAPELHLPVYNLKIKATDKAATGNPEIEPKARRSGVKNIAVFLEGKELKVPWGPQGCSGPKYSCPMEETYPVPMDEVQGGGVHKLKVIATDQVGNERESQIEFEYFPATGMKDEYVMQHFPLPNGEGKESEEEHPNRPELAVNVTNGNLVYRQKDVEVSGPAVDLEVERYYNSQLPEEDNTEWGDGWTLAQTPQLEPEETKEGSPPAQASMVRTSGVLESAVGLPTESGGTQFDKKLQAVVTKEPGGYEVEDQSGETSTSLAFDKAGKVVEMRAPGSAKIDYSYEAGDLSEVAVEDPGSATMSPELLEEVRDEPTEWSQQTTSNPTPPKTNVELSDVACSSATTCLAVGYDNANGRGLGERWNGSSWVSESTVSGRHPRAVSCGAAAKACWALATNSDGTATTEYWEGQEWGGDFKPVTPSGGSSVTLNGISCTAATTCTAVGSYVNEGKTVPLIERLSGFKWSVQSPATTTVAWLRDVSCVSSSECVAIGVGEGGKLISERWNGTTWSALSSPPNPASKYSTSTNLTDLSCASSSACMAIGYFYIDGKEIEEEKVKERFWFADSWNGTTWSAAGQGAEAAELLNDLTCTTTTNCTAVGSKGSKTLVQAWNGSKWSAQSLSDPAGQTPSLGAISCSATAACTTVGRTIGGGETKTLGERTVLRPEPAPEEDPKVEVNTSAGLVTSVEGDQAGQTTYAHTGELLTAVNGPDGKTQYEYDSAKRLTKVTLPNGTWGAVKYDSFGRVEAVTVSVEGGKAKVTKFTYKEEPRRTTVSPEGEPATIYDIAPDGSVLKSWNTQVAPEIENLSGSLYDNKETSTAIAPGDYKLLVQAYSLEGISTIEIVANGNQMVDELTCKKNESPTECKTVEDPWVTNTGSWPPGILQLEVIVTDSYHNVESTKFWVNIPYTPPPDPEAEEPPKFEDVLHFREEFGLDLDLKGNDLAIDERISDLIGDWNNPHTPSGEVARSTQQQWGVPLRPVDVAELNYRERYLAQAEALIPSWAASNVPGTYAGLYMDNRAGGILRVGFVSNQASVVDQLKAGGGLMAPDRVTAFTYQPSHTLESLNALLSTASQTITAPPAPPGVVSASVDVRGNGLRLGTTEVAATEAFAAKAFGGGTAVVVQAESPSQEFEGRYRGGSPFLAGTILRNVETACEAGFGAWSKVGEKQNGEPIRRRYVMTAGHCFPRTENAATIVSRMRYKTDLGVEIGKVERQGFLENPNAIDTDAEAVWLSETDLVPSWIYGCCGGNVSMQVTGVTFPSLGDIVCQSSNFVNKVTCGPVTQVGDFDHLLNAKTQKFSGWHWMIRAALEGGPGDSGGPVWMRETGQAVGLVAGGGEKGLAITPFMRPPNATPGQIAGIFSDPHLSPATKPLHVQVAK